MSYPQEGFSMPVDAYKEDGGVQAGMYGLGTDSVTSQSEVACPYCHGHMIEATGLVSRVTAVVSVGRTTAQCYGHRIPTTHRSFLCRQCRTNFTQPREGMVSQ